MTTSWEDLFEPQVIAKAEQLLERNNDVFELFDVETDQDGEILVVTIKDGRRYSVRIRLADDPVNYRMTCDCKDGKAGRRCRHMAIALMALDGLAEELANGEYGEISLAMRVAQTASEASLRSFLAHLFVGSPELLAVFQEDFPQEAAAGAELAVPLRRVDEIITAYLNQGGLINGNDIIALRNELAAFLFETNEAFLVQGNWQAPWALVCLTLQRVNALRKDERAAQSSYHTIEYLVTMLVDEGEELLQLVEEAPDLKQFAFDSLTELLAATTFQTAALEAVLPLYLVEFDDPEFQPQQLPVLQKQYKIARERFMQDRDETQLGLWVAALLDVLTDLDMTAEARKLYQKHRQLLLVQLWHLEDLIMQGRIKEMQAEFERLEAASRGDISALHRLFTFKRDMADIIAIIEQEQFAERKQDFIRKWQRDGDPLQYTAMQAKLPHRRWLEFRGDYLALMTGQPKILDSLAAAHDLPALLVELKQRHDFASWHKYRGLLTADYAADLLDAYEAEVKDRLRSVYEGRPQYQRAAKIIAEMAEFAGGKPRAEALIQELMAMYPQRPAMIDELAQISKLL